jgi:uncharacterized protein YggE
MKYLISLGLLLTSIFSISQSLDIPLITVRGSAVLFANPDEVLINIQVFKSDVNMSNARVAFEKQSKDIITFLKSQGIEQKHIQSQYLTAGPKRKRNSSDIENYFSRQNINVCIRDLSKYDDILNGLIDLDVFAINKVTFRTDDIVEKREEALRLAMRDAKKKAEMLAQEIGQTIGKAKLINEIQNQKTIFNAETYGRSTVSTSGTSVGNVQGFAPGQLEIKSIVTVSFELP